MMPLEMLSKIVCDGLSLMKNQTFFYQVTVKFTCSKLYNDFENIDTDNIIKQIEKYLCYSYYKKDLSQFYSLHATIYSNLIGYPRHYEDIDKIKIMCGDEWSAMRSNVNRVIHGRRNLPLYWKKEYIQNPNNVYDMVNRLYWVLQYIFAFYEEEVERNRDPVIHGVYYVFSKEKTVEVIHNLKLYLQNEFRILLDENYTSNVYWMLAVCIVESMIKQLDIYCGKPIKQEKYIDEIGNLLNEHPVTNMFICYDAYKEIEQRVLKLYFSENKEVES